MDDTDRFFAEPRKCPRCGGDDRYFVEPVVDWDVQFEYLVCDTCMTRECYMTGTTIVRDPDDPLGFRRIVPPERRERAASPANADAWERLSRYTDITAELRSRDAGISV
jgi:hypothetical protein